MQLDNSYSWAKIQLKWPKDTLSVKSYYANMNATMGTSTYDKIKITKNKHIPCESGLKSFIIIINHTVRPAQFYIISPRAVGAEYMKALWSNSVRQREEEKNSMIIQLFTTGIIIFLWANPGPVYWEKGSSEHVYEVQWQRTYSVSVINLIHRRKCVNNNKT